MTNHFNKCFEIPQYSLDMVNRLQNSKSANVYLLQRIEKNICDILPRFTEADFGGSADLLLTIFEFLKTTFVKNIVTLGNNFVTFGNNIVTFSNCVKIL